MSCEQPVSVPVPVPDAVPTTAKSHASSSALGAVLLIAQQFSSRGLTFILNQVLLRYLSPELLGTSTQLEVYSITVLFFARESLRVAIQRQADITDVEEVEPNSRSRPEIPAGHVDAISSAGRTQAIVNLAYVSITLGIFFSVTIGWAYTHTLSSGNPAVLETPYFLLAVRIYGAAAFLELLAEPSYVVVQQKSRFGIRATAESISTALRCLVTCASALWAHHAGADIGVLSFALGQITYSASLVVLYYWNVARISSEGGFSLLPRPIYSSENAFALSYFSNAILTLGGSFFSQSVFKHILTQGDTFLIAAMASPKAQGIYALANNYGGLVGRLILQPLEEMSRNFFGKLLGSTGNDPPRQSALKARNVLLEIIHTYVILSVFIVAVGPTIAPLCLNFLAGSRWQASGAGNVLATYCYYIPLLAINGVTEAFVASVATESEVHRQTVWMLAFSAGFACAAFIFLRVLEIGAEGLVWANALNMAFRIIWCSAFIQSYLRRFQSGLKMNTLMPRPMTTAAGLGAYAILRQMQSNFTGGLGDILKSGVVAGALLIAIATIERSHIIGCYRAFRKPL